MQFSKCYFFKILHSLMYQSVLYSLQAYLPIHILEAVMSEEKRWVKVLLPLSIEQSMKPWNAIRNLIPKRKKSGDVWIHFHTSPDDFFSHELSPLCNFLYEYICNKALHLHVFSLFSTHFKWSKLGLKQDSEASFYPINQDFLESCQYIAVANK